MKKGISTLIILLIFISCTEYISDKELKYMPYESGQFLIFENRKDKSIDTIYISNIKRFVPDGPQIHFNEAIKAYNRKNDWIISLSAGYGKYSDSYIKIRGLSGKHYLKELDTKKETSLKTRTMNFDDVILLEKKEGGIGNIIKVFWSKSKGIVEFVEKDETIWQLIELNKLK